jgi:hypothetical protein
LHTQQALTSIFRYNFITDFSTFENVQRVYALNKEKGMVLCSWPKGNKPAIPFVYSNEVWTGVEYQLAASLLRYGYTEEGLEMVKAIRERYRGFNRNPMAEIESGAYYARSFASWALLPALSGYHYDAATGDIEFSPNINPKQFYSFWSTGSAWGSIEISGMGVKLNVLFGKLKINRILLGNLGATRVMESNYEIKNSFSENNKLVIELPGNTDIEAGGSINLTLGRE